MMNQPAPAQIKAARIAANLTQAQAANLIYVSLRTWQGYEDPGGVSARKIPLGLWELFNIKVNNSLH